MQTTFPQATPSAVSAEMPPSVLNMKHMWQTLKTYFGDGFVANSSPMGFNTHLCHLERQPTKNHNIEYGVEINEDAMPLFSTLGDTCPPPCTCQDVQELCKHIDEYVETAPGTHADDYSLHTGKSDTSVDEACAYAMRDVMQWWINWRGSLDNHRWKHLYLAMGTVSDDVMIPPQHLIDGTFRFLGNTLADVLAGLLSENVHPDDVKFLEMCLWRQFILQYLEKIDPEIRPLLLSRTSVMVSFRNITGGTHGGAICLLAARGIRTLGPADTSVEMSAICDGLSLDIAKEALGVLQGETTETVAGDREQLKKELRWLFARCLDSLNSHPNAPILRRFATSGLHFVFLMDRYHERVQGNIRFPVSAPLRQELDAYTKTDTIAIEA